MILRLQNIKTYTQILKEFSWNFVVEYDFKIVFFNNDIIWFFSIKNK